MNAKKYAKVVWTANDIETLRPNWSPEKCEEWLVANEDPIQEAMAERGWLAIETLLDIGAG